MATDQEIDSIIGDLTAAFPEWKPPQPGATLKQYEDALRQYPADLLRRIANRCRDACLFFPKISEFHKAAAEIRAAENDTRNRNNDFPKTPPSPEMQAYLDNFRRAMVESGKWKEGRKKKPYNPYAGFTN
jgi:hypothetical protein